MNRLRRDFNEWDLPDPREPDLEIDLPEPNVHKVKQEELDSPNPTRPYKSIGERIKKIMGTNTQDYLGNLLGKKSGAIVSKWVNGFFLPTTNDIMKLCEIYSVSADYLLFGKEFHDLEPNPIIVESKKDIGTSALIPYFGDVAAGTFQDSYVDPGMEMVVVDKSYLNGSGNYFALRVNGDSMNKVIVDGSYIIVLRFEGNGHRIHNGDILLVRWGNEYTIKRVRKIENKIRLEPDSYIDGFSIQEFSPDDDLDVQIIGKIVYSFVRLLD